jgi:hypothetical protein
VGEGWFGFNSLSVYQIVISMRFKSRIPEVTHSDFGSNSEVCHVISSKSGLNMRCKLQICQYVSPRWQVSGT